MEGIRCFMHKLVISHVCYDLRDDVLYAVNHTVTCFVSLSLTLYVWLYPRMEGTMAYGP